MEMMEQPDDHWLAVTLVATQELGKRVKTRIGRPKQITDAGLIGVCLLFIAACLAQRMDEPLSHAITCFAFAIPALALGYIAAGWKMKGPGKVVVDASQAGAAFPEVLGKLAVFAGLVNVFLHYRVLDGRVFIGSSVAMIVLWLLCTGVALSLKVSMKLRKSEQREQQAQQEQVQEQRVATIRGERENIREASIQPLDSSAART